MKCLVIGRVVPVVFLGMLCGSLSVGRPLGMNMASGKTTLLPKSYALGSAKQGVVTLGSPPFVVVKTEFVSGAAARTNAPSVHQLLGHVKYSGPTWNVLSKVEVFLRPGHWMHSHLESKFRLINPHIANPTPGDNPATDFSYVGLACSEDQKSVVLVTSCGDADASYTAALLISETSVKPVRYLRQESLGDLDQLAMKILRKETRKTQGGR